MGETSAGARSLRKGEELVALEMENNNGLDRYRRGQGDVVGDVAKCSRDGTDRDLWSGLRGMENEKGVRLWGKAGEGDGIDDEGEGADEVNCASVGAGKQRSSSFENSSGIALALLCSCTIGLLG